MTLQEELNCVQAHFTIYFPELLEGDPRCKYAVKSKVVKVNGGPDEKVVNGTKGVVIGNAFILPLMSSWYAVYFPDDQEYLRQFEVDFRIWIKGEDNNKRIVILREKHLQQL